MILIKKFTALWIILLILVGGFAFLFFRFYHHDVTALEQFTTTYQVFDQAIADFTIPVLAADPQGAVAAGDLESKADAALLDLKSKASIRISSLIKNDADLMITMSAVASISRKEFEALKAYQTAAASQNADLSQLAKELADLTGQRKAAYTHFRQLGGF